MNSNDTAVGTLTAVHLMKWIAQNVDDAVVAAAVPRVQHINGKYMQATLLYYATWRSYHATIRAMGARCDCNSEVTTEDATPLLVAGCHCDSNTLRVFLEAFPNTNVNYTKHDGVTALYQAAVMNRPKAATLLLAHGADAAATTNGETAEMAARRLGNNAVADAIAGHVAWQSGLRCAWMAAVITSM